MSELIPIPHSEHELEKQPAPIEAWIPKQDGLAVPFEPVHIGVTYLEGGGNIIKDEAKTLVGEAGLIVEVRQSSAGYTGLNVEPLDGFEVSALAANPETNQLEWKTAREGSRSLTVSSDHGRLVTEGAAIAYDPNGRFGEEGVHAGIVQVTNPNGEVHHYLIGANFTGDADSWDVEGAMHEVTLPDSEQLGASPQDSIEN